MSAFDQNPKVKAMREEIADRTYRVKMKGMLISGALAVAAIGAVMFLPSLISFGAIPALGSFGQLAISGVFLAGSALSSLMTMKEVKQLEIDEQYLQSYMQGKNYWGEGYREEVVEKGFGGQQVMPHTLMAQRVASR